MMEIVYTPTFVRQYGKLPTSLREEARSKIALFQKDPQTPALRVHKLKGKLQGYHSFRVNYRYRIIFEYDSSDTVAFLQIGDHAVYG